MSSHVPIWLIAAFTTAGILIRPFKLPEAVWAVTGALLLVAFKLLSPSKALEGIAKGGDVYLFLTGMMLLAETAREEKLFGWLAGQAARLAKGSSARLFLLIYIVGTVVTIFLSNDATAVVLTPAVAAVTKTAKVAKPLPYLFICAFIANGASFVLPISNPANLVIYGSHMPPLLTWISYYGLPSVVSILITYFLLYVTQRKALYQEIEARVAIPELTQGGKITIWGIGATTLALLACSAFNLQLGLPTAVTGIITTAVVLIAGKKSPLMVIKGISWAVLPLVAGLFVVVAALNETGLIRLLCAWLNDFAKQSAILTAWMSGGGIALVSNITNNLPSGLIAGSAIQGAKVPEAVKGAILIGVDLGPNLSVTGSLATILWLVALRREGQEVSFLTFFRLGAVIMTAALIAALATLVAISS